MPLSISSRPLAIDCISCFVSPITPPRRVRSCDDLWRLHGGRLRPEIPFSALLPKASTHASDRSSLVLMWSMIFSQMPVSLSRFTRFSPAFLPVKCKSCFATWFAPTAPAYWARNRSSLSWSSACSCCFLFSGDAVIDARTGAPCLRVRRRVHCRERRYGPSPRRSCRGMHRGRRRSPSTSQRFSGWLYPSPIPCVSSCARHVLQPFTQYWLSE